MGKIVRQAGTDLEALAVIDSVEAFEVVLTWLESGAQVQTDAQRTCTYPAHMHMPSGQVQKVAHTCTADMQTCNPITTHGIHDSDPDPNPGEGDACSPAQRRR